MYKKFQAYVMIASLTCMHLDGAQQSFAARLQKKAQDNPVAAVAGATALLSAGSFAWWYFRQPTTSAQEFGKRRAAQAPVEAVQPVKQNPEAEIKSDMERLVSAPVLSRPASPKFGPTGRDSAASVVKFNSQNLKPLELPSRTSTLTAPLTQNNGEAETKRSADEGAAVPNSAAQNNGNGKEINMDDPVQIQAWLDRCKGAGQVKILGTGNAKSEAGTPVADSDKKESAAQQTVAEANGPAQESGLNSMRIAALEQEVTRLQAILSTADFYKQAEAAKIKHEKQDSRLHSVSRANNQEDAQERTGISRLGQGLSLLQAQRYEQNLIKQLGEIRVQMTALREATGADFAEQRGTINSVIGEVTFFGKILKDHDQAVSDLREFCSGAQGARDAKAFELLRLKGVQAVILRHLGIDENGRKIGDSGGSGLVRLAEGCMNIPDDHKSVP